MHLVANLNLLHNFTCIVTRRPALHVNVCDHFILDVIAQFAIICLVNSKHRKTLKAIFTEPVNGNIEWRKIEALFLGLGAVRTERAGSAISFVLNEVRADFHRPHPDKEALRYRVKDARKFLQQAGITP